MTEIYSFLVLFLISVAVAQSAPLSEETRLSDPDQILIIELTAYGRGGHGSSLNPCSAPHRLIRTLQRIVLSSETPTDPRSSPGSGPSGPLNAYVRSVEVLAVRAGEKTNVTPDQATARIRLLIFHDVDIKKVEEELSGLLESQVELKVIAPGSAESSAPS